MAGLVGVVVASLPFDQGVLTRDRKLFYNKS